MVKEKWLKSQSLNVDDSIQCMIEWKMDNGDLFTQTLLTNWIDPENTSAMSDQKIKFVGTKEDLIIIKKTGELVLLSVKIV